MESRQKSGKPTEEKIKFFDKLWPWVTIIFVAQIAYWYFVISHFHNSGEASQNWANAGTFGDLFGGLTCLFSGLAFAGLIVTIRQQSREIRLQIDEQESTRLEFEKQTEQFTEQNKLYKIQGYQADIYRRIELLKDLEKEVIFYKSNRIVTHEGETIREDSIKIFQGGAAITAMGLSLMEHQRVLFANKQPTKGDLVLIDDFANDMLMAYVSLQPLLLNFGDVLRDIKNYFIDSPDDMLRYFRMVINVFNIHMKTLVCLYKGFDIDASLVNILVEKGYIPKSALDSIIVQDKPRFILANLMMKNISAEQARKQWEELLKA